MPADVVRAIEYPSGCCVGRVPPGTGDVELGLELVVAVDEGVGLASAVALVLVLVLVIAVALVALVDELSEPHPASNTAPDRASAGQVNMGRTDRRARRMIPPEAVFADPLIIIRPQMRLERYRGRVTSQARVVQAMGTAATTRSLVVALGAVGVIVAQMAWRLPLGIPGHRGLIWLAALVVVALMTPRGTTTVTGITAAGVAGALGLIASGPLGFVPYIGAALLLEAAVAWPVVKKHSWLVILLAAPIHLVGVIVPVTKGWAVGVSPAALAHGLAGVAAFHLLFGLLGGALGWLVVRSLPRPSP